MADPSVKCGCGRSMTLDTLRGKGAYRCGCGARVRVTVPDVKQCGGYTDGERCRMAVTAGLPVDLCAGHAKQLRQEWHLEFNAHEREWRAANYSPEILERSARIRREGPSEFVPHPNAHAPIVYYMKFGDRIKIGTTTNLLKRREAIPHDEVLATEPGDRSVEGKRHTQFRHLRVKGEWFRIAPELLAHIERIKGNDTGT